MSHISEKNNQMFGAAWQKQSALWGNYRRRPSQSPGLCCRKDPTPTPHFPAFPQQSPLALNCQSMLRSQSNDADSSSTVHLSLLRVRCWDFMRCIHIILTASPIIKCTGHASFSPLCEALATFRTDTSEHIAWRLTGKPRCRVEIIYILENMCEMHCQNGRSHLLN